MRLTKIIQSEKRQNFSLPTGISTAIWRVVTRETDASQHHVAPIKDPTGTPPTSRYI